MARWWCRSDRVRLKVFYDCSFTLGGTSVLGSHTRIIGFTCPGNGVDRNTGIHNVGHLSCARIGTNGSEPFDRTHDNFLV